MRFVAGNAGHPFSRPGRVRLLFHRMAHDRMFQVRIDEFVMTCEAQTVDVSFQQETGIGSMRGVAGGTAFFGDRSVDPERFFPDFFSDVGVAVQAQFRFGQAELESVVRTMGCVACSAFIECEGAVLESPGAVFF